MPKPFKGISIPASKKTIIKRRYSVTQDVVSFRRCGLQYAAFNVHKYAPAQQTQTYFGTVIHQVLDRCHAHFHGIVEPSTKGSIPDNGLILKEEEIHNYFYEVQEAQKDKKTVPLPPSEIIKYFLQVENGLNSKGILAIRSNTRVQAVKILQYFNALEGAVLYPRVRDTEHRLQADQIGHILHGVVDLLVDSIDENVDPANCEMWDYKGSSRVGLNPKDLETYEFQMRVYAYLYQRKYGVLPKKAVLYFLNELDGDTCPSQRPVNALIEVSIEPDEIEVAINEFTKTVNQIEESRCTNEWQAAAPGNISEQDCKSCDLRWHCKTPNGGKGVKPIYP
ncbi:MULTISPECIES: PD-(D/E)XK nuclease family protein [Nostoc]|uniref:PD-(D/E)XK nuclease family protein n=1 Tax=Nostoc paludosum FACHB-159 TaxID=2692908 RepID=A0ABR8KIT0_9NOSO|nr:MULTISPECIES: PD-(D/E)XK nuclease family protein [Nostoc]MBD2682651.1 PD-(D/E)XK nuclease family protein [Nostoc sp. FACHB-857]MBD2738985.1 PD-(D/E)XK nuclease family protein [Nostoc paludosum FACHB-159]